jgi:hypothetical protein
MTKMRSFRFPEKELEQLREISELFHSGNQTRALIEAVNRYHKDLFPPSLQGYVRLDRVMDGQREVECPGCGYLKNIGTWIAVYSDGSVKGILCDDCVEAGRD